MKRIQALLFRDKGLETASAGWCLKSLQSKRIQMVFLFLSVSQMFMFFETDIKDLALFCNLKGFDKIQKEDKISHRLCYGLLG